MHRESTSMTVIITMDGADIGNGAGAKHIAIGIMTTGTAGMATATGVNLAALSASLSKRGAWQRCYAPSFI